MTNDSFDDDVKESRMNQYLKAVPWVGKYLERRDHVAVIRMSGVIADHSMMRRAGINFKKFEGVIDKAFDMSRLKAVALVINSPGGAPAQCSLISSKIRALAQKKDVPVFAFIEDVAASGGYWLSCIGDEIYAQETSIVGSIGVISAGFGLEGLMKRYDVERRVHTSGRDKSFLDPFKPEKAEDVARLQSLQSEMHESFRAWVHERRGTRLNGDDHELMEGAFWTGKGALERGLIDGVGDIHTIMQDKYGEDIKLVDCSPEKKNILSNFLPFGDADALFDPAAFIDSAESRAHWGRFGL
jgi:signal peptide peptidase SppA